MLTSKGVESTSTVSSTTKPKTVNREGLLPDPGEDEDVKIATVFEWRRNELTRTNGALESPGGFGAWQYEVLGNADDDSTPVNGYKTFKNIEFTTNLATDTNTKNKGIVAVCSIS